MQLLRIIVEGNPPLIVADRAAVAESFRSRLRGLIGRKELPAGEALILPACRMVHMFLMRFPIDVIFCSADHRVLHISKNLRPWEISKYVPGAGYAIELPSGTAEQYRLEAGMMLKMHSADD